MGKKYLSIDVYEAAQERLAYIFEEFESVLVAFSGGKDSGVCLNLCYDYAKAHGLLSKLAMFHLDYEAQYQMTTDYVTETFEKFSDIKRYWLCLPIKAQCCCTISGAYWIPWEQSKKDIWVRDMPKHDYVINAGNCKFKFDAVDYDVQDSFSRWFSQTHGKAAVIVGIRASESLSRYSAIKSGRKVNQYKGKSYILAKEPGFCSAYPIYDWETQDVWTYNSKFDKPYNRVYDLYYQAGLGIEQMRVASPFHGCGDAKLKYYKAIDPDNWGKMVCRVNGVNFVGIYGDTSAIGRKKIQKPDSFTWEEYCRFLLGTFDEKIKKHYSEKLRSALALWSDASKEPVYKRMCVCIIKNDFNCTHLELAKAKKSADTRRKAIEKFRKML